MSQKKKNKWSKPQLMVLCRGTPEESVLNECKYGAYRYGGPSGMGNYCAFQSGCSGVCSRYTVT